MKLEESIAAIEASSTIAELKQTLKKISEDYGFESFNFLDTGATHLDAPFHIGTLKPEFLNGYIDNKLIHVDPCVPVARRTNTPFSWGDVPVKQYAGIRKSGSQKTMEFAYDYGYSEGFIVPFHFSDHIGRINSSLIVFYWTSKAKHFKFLLSNQKYEMHLVMIYWAQRAVDIIGEEYRDCARFTPKEQNKSSERILTDRERDVLSWAARGKTALDTADILHLSDETIRTHIRNALSKLNASNKTHGVAKAIFLGLIDV